MSPVSRPLPRREVLPNGLVLLTNVLADRDAAASGSVCVRGSFPAGACLDLPGREGLAGFVGRLVRRGTVHRTAQEISAAVEDIGASFGFWAGTEGAGFSAKCLARHLPAVLGLLQDVAENPVFPDDDLEKTRDEILSHLREQEDSPRVRADRALRTRLYAAEHPYARNSEGTPESIRAITRPDCVAFHAAHYGADRLLLSVVGDFDAAQVREQAAGWRRGPARGPAPGIEAHKVTDSTGEPIRIPMPHKSQATLLLGAGGVPFRHPDYYALSLIGLILGGIGLMGRLGERLREQEGVVYGVGARAQAHLWGGEWVVSAGVRPEHVERARSLILEEIARVLREPVSDEEWDDAVEHQVGSLPLRLETNDGLAGFLLNWEYYGLGLDYLDRYPDLLRAETPARLQQAAQRYLDPEAFHTIIAGPV